MATDAPSPVTAGIRTTEFWTAHIASLLPVLTLVYHHDVSSYAQGAAFVLAGACQLWYIIGRSKVKTAAVKQVVLVSKAAAPADTPAAPVPVVVPEAPVVPAVLPPVAGI